MGLSRLTFGTRRDYWFHTRCLASYPVRAGGLPAIPLDLTNDGPAMRPLAIVLRREGAGSG